MDFPPETGTLPRPRGCGGPAAPAPAASGASAPAAAAAGPAHARLLTGQPAAALQLDEPFDRAWRRVGLALDRTGFTVEDRDRSQGTYFVRYVPPNPEKKERSFLGRLFGSSEKPEQPLKYRINLRTEGERTLVSVLNANGAPEASENAQRIVQVIAEDLR